MPTFVTPKPIAVGVEVAGAQVRIAASERSDTVVRVDPLDTTSRKDVKVAENTEVGFADGRLSVKTTVSGHRRGSVAITIELPAGSLLDSGLAHSTVHVNGPLGASELNLASGTVQLDSVGSLKANIGSGEVAIGHVGGAATIDGTAFVMRIGEAKGTVGLSNSGGEVWIGHAAAGIEFESAACDLGIGHADGDVTARSASGAIRVGRMSHGRARLTTGSGDIEVGVADGTAAAVDAASERGAVHNYLSAPADPAADAAKVAVWARTRDGDITVQRG